jgi:serine/threonine protein kinase
VPLTNGQTLQNRYRILGLLGQGGMGAVYQAADTRLGGKAIAIKEMSDAGLPTPQQRQQAVSAFSQEAQMLAYLNHPNLPKVSDYFTELSKHYIVMEFVEGQTLEDYLSRRGGSVSEAEARGLGSAVVRRAGLPAPPAAPPSSSVT